MFKIKAAPHQEAWHTAAHGVAKSRTTEQLNNKNKFLIFKLETIKCPIMRPNIKFHTMGYYSAKKKSKLCMNFRGFMIYKKKAISKGHILSKSISMTFS